MRAIAYTLLLFILIVFPLSCKENPLEEYGDTLIREYKRSWHVEKGISLERLQKAIQAFHASNGRYPEDIRELEGFMGERLSDERYDYNRDTGTIKLKR